MEILLRCPTNLESKWVTNPNISAVSAGFQGVSSFLPKLLGHPFIREVMFYHGYHGKTATQWGRSFSIGKSKSRPQNKPVVLQWLSVKLGGFEDVF